MARILELLLTDGHQRMLLGVVGTPVLGEPVNVFLGDKLIGNKIG